MTSPSRATKINLLLIFALVLTTGWSSLSRVQSEPADLKAQFAANPGSADVSEEALAALATTAVGIPCTTDLGTLPGVSDGNGNVGMAGPYPCTNVGLQALVPFGQLGGGAGNDSWGWEDPESDDEAPFRVAIMGTGNGTSFVDVSNPTIPVVLGFVSQAGGATRGATGALWRDVKVNDNHAYIVTERGGGMQVVDLTQLRDLRGTPGTGIELDVKATYTEAGANAFHNIVINEDSDRAYLVGGNFGGGLHIVDISDPAAPSFAGAFDLHYIHDAQCVIYDGPDDDYNGNNPDSYQAEICFNFTGNVIDIVDVTDPSAAKLIQTFSYDREGYTHQGWLTEDHSFVIFNDETDEQINLGGTRTFIAELADLDAQIANADVKVFIHDTVSTDHNLYIRGDLVFQANYNAGLKVFRFTAEGLRNGELDLVGSFDVDPGLDAPHYGGAWNVFPYFGDDTIVLSSLDEGLYVLDFNDPAAG